MNACLVFHFSFLFFATRGTPLYYISVWDMSCVKWYTASACISQCAQNPSSCSVTRFMFKWDVANGSLISQRQQYGVAVCCVYSLRCETNANLGTGTQILVAFKFKWLLFHPACLHFNRGNDLTLFFLQKDPPKVLSSLFTS